MMDKAALAEWLRELFEDTADVYRPGPDDNPYQVSLEWDGNLTDIATDLIEAVRSRPCDHAPTHRLAVERDGALVLGYHSCTACLTASRGYAMYTTGTEPQVVELSPIEVRSWAAMYVEVQP